MPPARVGRSRLLRFSGAIGLAVGLLLPSGCAPAPGSTPAPAASAPIPTAPAPTSPSSSASPPGTAAAPTTATEVRDHAASIPAIADLRILVPDPGSSVAVESTAHSDAQRWTWAHGRAGDGRLALLAAPDGARFTMLGDRSLVVTDAGGTAVLGIAPLDVGTFELLTDDLLELRAHPEQPSAPVHAWLGRTAVLTATWGRAEGGRSLAVEPSPWTRAAGEAGAVMAWQHIEQVAPEDATPGMQDQLVCHALGAPDKPTWNLEPPRPDVGLLSVLAAGCNPT